MKSLIAVLLGICLLPLGSAAQSEVAFQFGGANYIGDLSPGIAPSETRPALGLLYRNNLNAKWKFRFGAVYGRISGDDRNFQVNETRNLNFRSNIIEVNVMMEYHLLPYMPGATYFSFSPYIFAGVAGFRFNPQLEYSGAWLNAREIGTEGQFIPGSNLEMYSQYNVSIPFGIGFKKILEDDISFGIELGFRPTFTDYLDDVSNTYPDKSALLQTENGVIAADLSDRRDELGLEPATAGSLRGNPNNNDWYGFLMITISKRLGYASCYAF